jgi:peptidoglycan-associated lipoprotein
MPRVRLAVCLVLLVSFSACSSSGKGGSGSPDDYDSLGEGNIPIAEAGSELKDVNFDYDSATLSAAARSDLKDNSQWLLDNPEQKVVVEGHCDERGTAEYNLALGLRRAQSVKDFLRSSGVRSSQMTTQSYGEELPLDPSSNEAAWAKNRRAHFSLK